jgi:predicted RNA binding protein YcfA (HicA-like mRNA interferase family)
MPKLVPTDWQTQVAIFEADGFKITRQKGSHLALTKDGVARPVIIPKYKEVGVDIIQGNMRTAGMSRKRYFQLKSE